MIKYYTRACNFIYGNLAKSLIKKGKALPLCGNNYIAFQNIELFKRKGNKIKNRILSLKRFSEIEQDREKSNK